MSTRRFSKEDRLRAIFERERAERESRKAITAQPPHEERGGPVSLGEGKMRGFSFEEME